MRTQVNCRFPVHGRFGPRLDTARCPWLLLRSGTRLAQTSSFGIISLLINRLSEGRCDILDHATAYSSRRSR